MRPKWTEPQTCFACQNHAFSSFANFFSPLRGTAILLSSHTTKLHENERQRKRTNHRRLTVAVKRRLMSQANTLSAQMKIVLTIRNTNGHSGRKLPEIRLKSNPLTSRLPLTLPVFLPFSPLLPSTSRSNWESWTLLAPKRKLGRAPS